jgi:hypothetical protein
MLKNNIITKVKNSIINTIKETSIKTNNQKFVNHDGTIAENRETYISFKQDVISSYGRC